MAFSVQMPALGESVTEGTVTRWLKQEGDRVEVDEPLLEVSTDKVDTEIPSPAAGVLQRIVAGEDETVEVGGELAVIGDGDEPASDDGGDTPAESAVEAPAEEEPAEDEPASPPNQAEEPAEKPQASTKPSGSGGGTAITMPELGESVTEGTVTRWLKEVGDEVAVDEPLLEVSTDKVDTEIPSPIAGTLLEITAAEDETVEVGGQLALIGDASAAPAEESAPEPEPEQEQPKQEQPKQEQPEQEQPEQPEPAEAPKAEAPKSGTDGGPAQVEEKAEREEVASELPSRPDSGSASTNGSGDAPTGAPYVTPLVRKLAAEHDVDLSTITGSGVGGRIRKQDVLAAAEAAAPEPEPAAPAPAAAASSGSGGAPSAPTTIPKAAANAPEPGTTVKLPRLRQVIAKRMSESLAVSAQLTTVQQVDVTRIAKLRAKAKAEFERREGVKLTYLPFFAKATVEALKAFPQVNASISEDGKEVTYHGGVHLAIAVDTPRGLLVPVIKNAEDLNLAGLARKIADVAARTRDNKIGPDELSGGTFTITNIGSAGALFDTPIINQPQVAILGTGVITKQPMVITGTDGDDVIAVRSVCYLPMTYDHRLVDGADAGRFVSAIKARLEEGAFEADLGL
ncbi:2-oxoglutarate dehydrogenase, E2 component, dihydrolipoamide succinyltransferase [Pseudonocardia broussonetiae]|uniref:Dihydrolipoamide acetyltransferase component of pyruvate dehydrogenase complex n=1 Tax=Pseudonocardia broussonetiae TaxID=2736640 RepID=A0A6M6JKL9_9PSEU|nr:2-oxoglutarate dehydrogenase, E2 component, dihydrolipoamide succinyltransferase [Pseudonocardia broussonetiae]QJY47610.1 2-oxoglutarate dehydrogenase, E2 component, dihydrolipoamide succinyltransferase [Pseudonocardia broussonetiae]